MRAEKPILPRSPDGPDLRRASLFAAAGLASALLVAAIYPGYGLHLLLSGQTGDPSQEVFAEATAETVRRQLRATASAATVQVEIAQTQTAKASRDAAFRAQLGPAGSTEPCFATAGVTDPCAVGRTVQFPGAVPVSVSFPDEPPSLEAMLFNSWDAGDLADVPEHALLSATHIVARGRFANESLRCDTYPVVNPSWAVGHADFRVDDPPEGQRVVVDFGIDHWMCFAEFAVLEYIVGIGGSGVIVNLAAAAVPLDAGVEIESIYDQQTLDIYRSAVTDHFFGSEWVVWLGPSYSTAVESWTAYSLWDVQRGDDDIVRVVSPVAAHYEEIGLTGSTLERLRPPLTDFRRDIKAASLSRLKRTSGRIGVDTDTPRLVTDVFKLEDYYEEVGAYYNPIATPAPPPTRP